MRIAIVEDDEKACLELVQAVSSWIDDRLLIGSIQAFSSPDDFMAVWIPHAFSLVLMDCILSPEPDAPTGLDLVRVLRKKNDDTPVVFITNSPDLAIDGYTVHAAGSCSSPFPPTLSMRFSIPSPCLRRLFASGRPSSIFPSNPSSTRGQMAIM